VKSEQRNFKRFGAEQQRTTALSVFRSDRKQRPIAVIFVSRLSCQLLDCSQTSLLHRITNRNCLKSRIRIARNTKDIWTNFTFTNG